MAQLIDTLRIASVIQALDNDKVILKFGLDILGVSMKGSKEKLTLAILDLNL